MESIGKITKFDRKTQVKPSSFAKATEDDRLKYINKSVKPNTHLHSPAHLLADELCQKLNDKRHFGFYLKMATLYDHNYLRGLAGQIMESATVKTPGRLFAYLIKKNNLEKKSSV